MKLVTFARSYAPHGVGDTRLVPDDVADRLGQEGALSASEAWPSMAPPSAVAPKRAVLKINRPAGAPDSRRAR